MYEITEQPFESYQDFKNAMDQTVNSTVQNIVKIGYLLKVARDTGILQESGYTTMRDFAQAEYNIDASTASRFIGINDKYSLGGNSMTLDDKYNGFETSKLAEMLTLPDSIIEEIPPEMKRDEIRDIKAQLKEEAKTSDMEIYIEHAATVETGDSDLFEVLKQSLEENYEMFKECRTLVCERGTHESLYSTLAPAGYATMIGRIPGKGRMMLSIKSQSEDPVLINTRTGEKTEHPWDEIFTELDNLISIASPSTPEEDYKETFGHEPKKEEHKSAVTVSKAAKPDKKSEKASEKKPKTSSEPPKASEKTEEPEEELPFPDEEDEPAAGEEEPEAAGEEEPKAHVTDLSQIAPAQPKEPDEEPIESEEAAGELTDIQKDLFREIETLKDWIRGSRWRNAKDVAEDITDRLRHLSL